MTAPLSRSARSRALLGLVLAVGLLSAAPVVAQEGDYYTTLGSNDTYKHAFKPHIRLIQVTLGLARERRAVALFAADDLETWTLARWCAMDGYKLIRAAHEAIQIEVDRAKFPNPVAQMAADLLWSARRKLIAANGALSQGYGLHDARLRAQALELIAQSIPDIESALEMMH